MASILFITDPDNWEVIRKENIMGINERFGRKLIKKIQAKDKCVFYVTKNTGFKGVFEIITKNVNRKIKWNKGTYKYLIGLNPLFIPDNPVRINNILDNLKFIKNKEYYGLQLRYEKFIPDEDLNFILETMSK